MKLRTKIMVAVVGALSALLCAVYGLSSHLILQDHKKLEVENANQNIDRVEQTLQSQVETLHLKSADWANWDDTYQFMQDKNRTYITSNLLEPSVINLGVDTILYLSKDRKLFFASSVQRKGYPKPNAKLLRTVLLSKTLLSPGLEGGGSQGFVEHQGKLLKISMRPIRPSSAKGTMRGWIVFASYFDDVSLEKLRTQTRLQTTLLPYPLPSNFSKNIGMARSVGSTPYLDYENEARLNTYFVLKDMNRKPVRIVQTMQARGIYQQGLHSRAYLFRLTLLSGVIFGCVMLLFLERFVIRNLASLTQEVMEIGEQKNWGHKVREQGSDELSRLAKQINRMLGALSSTMQRLEESENALRGYSNDLETLVLERTRQLAQSNLSLAHTNSALENALDGVLLLGSEGHFLAANAACTQITGYDAESLLKMNWTQIVSEPDHIKFRKAILDLKQCKKAEIEVLGVRKDFSFFHLQVLLVSSIEAERTEIHCFLKDISERKRFEVELSHQAYHDSLTELPNRTFFAETLALELRRAKANSQTIAALFIDLDNFKQVNDSYGHEEGDRLLVEVARRLTSIVPMGQMIARLGGDEFTVLLTGLESVEEACNVAEAIANDMKRPVVLEARSVVVGCSIGIAHNSEASLQAEEIMRHADTAMYHTKLNGKGGYTLFHSDMNEAVLERTELEMELRSAFDNHEFRVVYQPIMDLQTGVLAGAEALMRWNHPRLGVISPAKFIPIAEETGLIVPLGAWVLREACKKAMQWQAHYHESETFVMGVNLSVRQLEDPDLVQMVAQVLAEVGLPPHRLKLEITESVMMVNLENTIERLHELKSLGVMLAIDDFGTGYSSLSSLQNLPVDNVKIDQSFIRALSDGAEHVAIVRAIIDLCQALKLEVTSEGVETLEQWIQLQVMGCNKGQGYHFAKPTTQEEFEKLLPALQEQTQDPKLLRYLSGS